jgi:hypothetical protein
MVQNGPSGVVRVGGDDKRRAAQVNVLDYKSDDDFIVALQPEDENERIVLAKLSPADTLQKTVAAVRSRAGSAKLKPGQGKLQTGESLVVPTVNIDVWKMYEELYHKLITTPGPLKDAQIVAAMQTIRFRLDEGGAILKSDALMAEKAAEEKIDQPNRRQFFFNKPFLVLLQRRNAERPYFALWVGNAELLVPWK